ncbi:sigma-70 family RNA polymerase sigma factor [Saccharibacillus sp. CPCC 101409]|uniref:RNA polymerase sigma factor n=1 Tax=Saccharibacillus sp. CPCC 101409 TaxID=3058041 RepID=UPI00267312A8|nr:sigma-70 family RNA polymerase sigma factor [Saccharibacillus sp. CPCC 101409]MDO3408573.1 sigma-70 family RNA polymerase sigma factor [Saccharibacillus sp. CPCC 101409]
MNEQAEDLRLIRRIADRDAGALEQLYDAYERSVYAFAYRLLNDAMTAEEAVQELFLRIWNNAERYDSSHGKLSTWMFALTRNISIDLIRRRSARAAAVPVEDEHLNAVVDEASDTELAVERTLEGENIRAALNELNDEQQQVIDLIYYQGLTQQEVSTRCEIPLGTVKSRVRLALKQLQRRLSGAERGESRA